jgi:O-antigen ligase
MTGMSWRQKFVGLSEKNISSNLLLTFAIILMSIGVIFSKSRSGIFILLLSFILIFGLTALYFKMARLQTRWTRRFLVAVFLVIVFISLQVGINATLERFAMDKLLQEGRPTYWANTIEIFSHYPIFGSGLGTFPSLYPDWEEGGTLFRLYHAHNDYLEYLTELGVVGMILLLGGILSVLISSFLIWRVRRHPEVKGIALGGIVSIICILIHSLTDFNLHIPANMLLFSVVLSLTLVTAHYKKGENKKIV